jgi:malonyl-CoA O-methyltransferase
MRYWKPIQTGIEKDDDTATVRELGSCRADELFDQGYRIPRPLSPHLAAGLSQIRIRISDIEAWIAGEPGGSHWVIEGAGGVLVPINDWEMMIDVMVHLALPVLLVTRSTLGTINHTLLALDAIRARGLRVASVLMVGERNPGNRDAIERFGRVHVAGEMPLFETLTAKSVGDWARSELDPANHMAEWFS